MKTKKIVYIAGYGRSGSTLLERILSSNQKMFGVGELFHLLRLINGKNNFCSCGNEIHQCDFWSKIIAKINAEYDIEQTKQDRKFFESITGIFSCIAKRLKKQNYQDYTKEIFSEIFKLVPSETKYIIDSSKTARNSLVRPVLLSNLFDVKVIHLIRDGRGCMWSNLKGSNQKLEAGVDPTIPFAGLRTALNWPVANSGAHFFQLLNSQESYCRVKYENFVENPENSLAKIGDFLGVDFAAQINMLKLEQKVPLGHQLDGNRLRKKEKIILQPDLEWKSKLGFEYRLLFWLFAWPWGLFYKYF
jgi:hypothetical protein